MEDKRRDLTNSQGRWVRGSRQRARKMIVALVMMIVGYFAFQLCLIALNTVNCRSGAIDEFRTTGSNFFMTHRPVHKAPEHSTIICQLDETHSDFDRRCYLENVCWDRRDSTFVYLLDASRPGAILSGTTLPNGKPRKISVKRILEKTGMVRSFFHWWSGLARFLWQMPLSRITKSMSTLRASGQRTSVTLCIPSCAWPGKVSVDENYIRCLRSCTHLS